MKPSRVSPIAGAIILLGITLLAYLPALRGGYVWDDDVLVTENENIRTGAGLARTWVDPRANNDYYPLTHTSWWLEYRFFGLNPFVFHLDNVLLHAGTAILFWTILKMLGVPGALVAAAAFALHPVHVESVAWVAERKNVLSGFLCLLAVWSYLRFALAGEKGDAGRRRLHHRLSLAFFLAAMFSKPVTMAVVPVLPLLIWWKRGRLTWKDLAPVAPYIALAVPMAVLTIWLQYTHVGAGGASFHLSFPQRLILAGRALWFYAGKLVWPQNLSFSYSKWSFDPGQWWQYCYPIGTAAILAVLACKRRLFGLGPLVALLAFVVLLTPALGFINIYWHRYYYVADHIQYLASMSLIAAGIAAVARVRERGPWHLPTIRCLAAAVVTVLGFLTWQRAAIYKDEETLWRDTLDKNPSAANARTNLGILLTRRGASREAQGLLEAALVAEPGSAGHLINLGALFKSMRLQSDAEASYRAALRIDPGNVMAHYELGCLLRARGEHREATVHFAEVEKFSQSAKRPCPSLSRNNPSLQGGKSSQ